MELLGHKLNFDYNLTSETGKMVPYFDNEFVLLSKKHGEKREIPLIITKSPKQFVFSSI